MDPRDDDGADPTVKEFFENPIGNLRRYVRDAFGLNGPGQSGDPSIDVPRIGAWTMRKLIEPGQQAQSLVGWITGPTGAFKKLLVSKTAAQAGWATCTTRSPTRPVSCRRS